jgi:glycosidase
MPLSRAAVTLCCLASTMAAASVAGAAGAADTAPGARAGPPAWARDAVFYELLLDRFRNGDPRNDPRPADLRGAWPSDPPRDWQVTPWTSGFYTLRPHESAAGREFAEAAAWRRYGGDLAGLIEKLDHLQSLGVNTLLLGTVFEAPSARKNDPAFLHHVDNNYGPEPDNDRIVWATEDPAEPSTWKWTSADRLLLRALQECHRRQMRVVLDLPATHVGQTFWAFRDVRQRGTGSRYAAWFAAARGEDPPDLPEWQRQGDTLAPGPREHLRAVLKRWGDPNGDGDPSDGVDGWRVTSAERVARGLGRDLRAAALGLNPDALLVADAPEGAPVADAFDTWSSRGFAAAARGFFFDKETPQSGAEIEARLAAARSRARPDAEAALLNLLSALDLDRVASAAVNPDRALGKDAGPKESARYDVRAPRPEEAKRIRLAVVLQFTAAGAPVVFYGDEVGLWGATDPDNGKPMLWRELRFEDESGHPTGQPRRADPVRFDEDLLKLYQTLGRMRSERPALRQGAVEKVLADEMRRLYAFERVLEGDRVGVAFNMSDKEQAVELPFTGEPARDALTGRRYRPRDGKVALTLLPVSAVVLVTDARP